MKDVAIDPETFTCMLQPCLVDYDPNYIKIRRFFCIVELNQVFFDVRIRINGEDLLYWSCICRGPTMVVIALKCPTLRCTFDTVSKLFALAEEAHLKQKINSMFNGEHINSTENRSVLHVALRAAKDTTITSDGKNVVPDVWQVFDKIRKFSDKVRNGSWVGATGKALTNVIAIGIGGSFLGPLFVHTALQTDPEASKSAGGRQLRLIYVVLLVAPLELYDKAIVLLPVNVAYHCNRAAALIGLRRLSEAVKECYEAIRLDDGYVRAHHRLGSLLVRWFRRGLVKLPKPLDRLTGYNAFWYSHHLFVIVYILLLVHGWFLYLVKEWYKRRHGCILHFQFCFMQGKEPSSFFWSGSYTVHLLKVAIYPGNVLTLQMSKPPKFRYKSGQYMFVQCPIVSSFEWHPFSITSAPDDEYLAR